MIWTTCTHCGESMIGHGDADLFCSGACRDLHGGTVAPNRPTWRSSGIAWAAVIVALLAVGAVEFSGVEADAAGYRQNVAAGMEAMR